MRTGIIINPYAGRNRRIAALRQGRARLARAALAACGIEGEVAFTGRRGEARDRARSMIAAGATGLVCWGGDGTINEVAAEAASREIPLGIVPSGSGNGLARELGLSRQPEAALRTALRGAERVLDAGEIDGRFFANVAGVGFDAHLARIAARFARRGAWAYFAAGIPELLAYRPATYRIRAGAETFRADALLVTIANGRQYGNGAIIAPGARLDDGRLELVCVPALSTTVLFWQAAPALHRHRRSGARGADDSHRRRRGDRPGATRIPRGRRGVHRRIEPARADPAGRPARARSRPGRRALIRAVRAQTRRASGGAGGAGSPRGAGVCAAETSPGQRRARAGSQRARQGAPGRRMA